MGRSKHSGEDRIDTGVPGENVRNYKGKLSEQSKARRKKRKMSKNQLSGEEVVKHIRSNPTNRMPTKGTEIASKVKKFFTGK